MGRHVHAGLLFILAVAAAMVIVRTGVNVAYARFPGHPAAQAAKAVAG